MLKALALKLVMLMVISLAVCGGPTAGSPRPCAALFSPSPALKPPLFSGGEFSGRSGPKRPAWNDPGKPEGERARVSVETPTGGILPGFGNAKQTGHPQGDQASGRTPRRTGANSGISPQIIRAEGKGAGWEPSPKLNLPLRKKMEAFPAMSLCHHPVSVRAGTKAMTVLALPSSNSVRALAVQKRSSRP